MFRQYFSFNRNGDWTRSEFDVNRRGQPLLHTGMGFWEPANFFPTEEDCQQSWLDYMEFCATTGTDPLGELDGEYDVAVPEQWRIFLFPTDLRSVKFAVSRIQRVGATMAHVALKSDLPCHVWSALTKLSGLDIVASGRVDFQVVGTPLNRAGLTRLADQYDHVTFDGTTTLTLDIDRPLLADEIKTAIQEAAHRAIYS